MTRGSQRQTAGMLMIAAAVLIYLLVRYGASAVWTWR
jgi:hypothetical protein